MKNKLYMALRINILKTLIFNFKIFPLKIAIRLPVFIGRNVRLVEVRKKCVEINDTISSGMIKIGVMKGSYIPSRGGSGYFKCSSSGRIIFEGKAVIGGNTSIVVNENARLKFGKNFTSNSGCQFFVDREIEFGNNVVLGWHVAMHDGDGHVVISEDGSVNSSKPIHIGNNVWIAAEAIVLKGVTIYDNCVIARNSMVTKGVDVENCVIGGIPAKIIKKNIKWKM